MKKTILYLGSGLLVLAIAVYIGVQFFLGSIVKGGVNRFGPKITQTKVELSGANLSPLSGVGTLSGLYVGNPQGWSSPKAFYLGKIHVDLEPKSIFGDRVVINEIVIDEPDFVYETKLVANNISDLLKNIENSVGKKDRDAEPKSKTGEPKKFEVKRFVLQNGKVTVTVSGAGTITIPLPTVTLTDLGTKEGGLTANQLAVAVMRSVTATVAKAATEAIAKGTTQESLKKAGDTIKGIFGGKK